MQCHHIPPTGFSRYSLPSQLLHPLTNSPLKIKATLMHSQKHRHTRKQKFTHSSGTCVHSSPALMHTHGWRGRGRGHGELTEETLGIFLARQGCSALSRTRLQMRCQHSLQMCRDSPGRGALASKHMRSLERVGMEKKRKTWQMCMQGSPRQASPA